MQCLLFVCKKGATCNEQPQFLRHGQNNLGTVVGRKTWYGTHSERGAITAAILFSIVETCKLVGVNPRQYFEELVKDMLAGAEPYTPADFKKSH